MADAMTKTAEEIVRAHPEHTARGLARMLKEAVNDALTLEQARSRIRYVIGQKGKLVRKTAKMQRPARRPGQMRALPRAVPSTWSPYVFDVTGRVGILSDVHVPYHSETAVLAAVRWLKKQGLSGLLLNGDIADFYSISRWQKDPRKRNFSAELEAVRGFVAWVRQEFPRIPIVYKLGNHEERWEKYIAEHAPELSEDPLMSLGQWLHLDEHKVELVSDQRPVMLGRLPVLHGHEIRGGSPVSPAKGAYNKLKHTALIGHHHQTSGHCEPDMNHRETYNWSTGCLADLTPDYARFNRYNHGFAMVDVKKGGDFDVWNLRIADGVVRSS